MDHIFFIHSSVDGHLTCVHVLAIANSAAMNTGVHISFQIMVFFRYMSRSGIAGSYGIFSLFITLTCLIYNSKRSQLGREKSYIIFCALDPDRGSTWDVALIDLGWTESREWIAMTLFHVQISSTSLELNTAHACIKLC